MSLSKSYPARQFLNSTIALAATLTVFSCGEDRVVRPTTPDVRLSVHASATSGNPANPISVQAAVWNAGGGEVTYYHDCCHDEVQFIVTDRNGLQLTFDAPYACRCAIQGFTLPQTPLTNSLTFRGAIWQDGRPMAAPTGRYVIVVTFVYRIDTEGPEQVLRREIPFNWYGS